MLSQFAWTKGSHKRPQNKLQNLKSVNEWQAQEEGRQSFVDSMWKDVELDEVTESAVVEASAGDQPIDEETSKGELENKNLLPAEPSAEEQIKILKVKIKDLEEQVEDLKESKFCAENISKNSKLLLQFYPSSSTNMEIWGEDYASVFLNSSGRRYSK